VSDSTTPAELFTLLQRMIAPLEDAHTGIRAADLDRRYHGRRNGPHRLEESQFAEAYALAGRYLAGPLRRWCNGQVEFGMLRPDVGYLRIRSFGGYTAEGSFESGLAALEAALDTVFAGAASWRGLVTDVRINGGGADPYGLAIAARLATRAYQAYAKQARSDPGDPTRWTDPQPSLVRPTSRPGFGGPVVHLIGIHSLSAAETFTQALINREPAVKFVGEPTQGVFSDVLSRRLPNGWRFWLPNERFVTNGRAYDGPGIPPHVEVPVFAAADRRAGRDRALERALELLDRRQKEAP
jgi:C-terminal processing protease CtpA/Prc